MSPQKKPLRPTLTMAVGILLGGLAGAGVGLLTQYESAVIVGYIAGNLLGAVAGTYLGWQWHRRLHPASESFLMTYWPALRKLSRASPAGSEPDVSQEE